jgi:hypothetical protein
MNWFLYRTDHAKIKNAKRKIPVLLLEGISEKNETMKEILLLMVGTDDHIIVCPAPDQTGQGMKTPLLCLFR